MDKEIRGIEDPRDQQLRLLEYSRLDHLNPAERRIYLRNKIQVSGL